MERRFEEPHGVKLALERRFEGPNGLKLALERRFGRPNGVKLALERRFGGPNGVKLALERRLERLMAPSWPWNGVWEAHKQKQVFRFPRRSEAHSGNLWIDV